MKEKMTFKKSNISSLITKYWLLFVTILLIIVFTIVQNRFISTGNIRDILSSTCILGIVSIGVSLVMITGEIDFCCGMELCTGAVVVGILMDHKGFPYILAILIALAACALIGLMNGILHVKIGIPGFIATMGTSLLVQGILKWLTNSTRLFSVNWPSYYTFLGQGKIMNIPITIICLAVIAVIFLIYTERTKNGKKLYAVGANDKACRYVGIDSRKEKMKSFIICAVLCGFAGIINGSMLNSASAYMGDTTLLNALMMLMLGATFYRVGVFNIPGTILGALLVNILTNGMTMAGAATWQKYIVQGIVMLFAVVTVTVIRARTAKLD